MLVDTIQFTDENFLTAATCIGPSAPGTSTCAFIAASYANHVSVC